MGPLLQLSPRRNLTTKHTTASESLTIASKPTVSSSSTATSTLLKTSTWQFLSTTEVTSNPRSPTASSNGSSNKEKFLSSSGAQLVSRLVLITLQLLQSQMMTWPLPPEMLSRSETTLLLTESSLNDFPRSTI